MGLRLGISTSLSQFKVVIGEGTEVLYRSDSIKFDYSKDLTLEVAAGLEKLGKNTKNLDLILVDIGPGGTSSVRTGVAIANALAFSLNLPVAGVSSMELIGLEVFKQFQLPVLTLVKSIRNNAYFGLYTQDSFSIEYGQFEELAETVCAQHEKICVAGSQRDRLIELYGKQIVDSNIAFVNADILITASEKFIGRAGKYPQFPDPITEQTLGF